MDWYTYDGSGSVNDPLNYFRSLVPNCPTPKINLCAIRAVTQFINQIERPIITSALQAEIAAAISNQLESANVRLRQNVNP